MKSVEVERQRARRVLVGTLSCGLIAGFIACSSSNEHKVAQHNGVAGDGTGGSAAGAAGANDAQQGGTQSSAAGQDSGGAAAGAGASNGGAAGGDAVGGAAGQATSGAGGASDFGGAVGAAGATDVGGAAVGGQSNSDAGGAAGMAEAGGAAGAGGNAAVDPVCGVGLVQVGAYSLWCGKVNEHTDEAGAWQPDADCSSGCNLDGVAYCQKFYPSATAFVAVPQVDVKDWKNAGFVSGQAGACNDSTPDAAGISGQAACCAPL